MVQYGFIAHALQSVACAATKNPGSTPLAKVIRYHMARIQKRPRSLQLQLKLDKRTAKRAA